MILLKRLGALRWIPLPGIILSAVLAAGLCACRPKPESITIGLPFPAPAFTPIYIAQQQDLFARNGLAAAIKQYDSGQATIKGMQNDEVEIAGISEYPIVGNALNKGDFKILATINKSLSFYIVGRKDRGIVQVSDCKGKRIGVTLGGVGEFYLGRFLELHGLRMSDVKLVHLNPPSALNDITGGNMDAAVVFQPYAYDISKRLGGNRTSWQAQSGQSSFTVVMSKSDWIARHPKLVRQFLMALAQAENFILNHPAEAKATVKKLFNLDEAFVEENWHEHQFSLSLDQSLITALEDEARWMIASNLTPSKQVPDFLDFVHEDALKAIKPNAVNIIR